MDFKPPLKEEIEHYLSNRLKAPIPWIGFYITVASLVCLIAITADVFVGFRSKRFWFPCKFFSLNAASLTLLAVATKMPLDLSTFMPWITDELVKLSSIVLMSIIMGNFMPSLGSTDDKTIFTNIAALGCDTATDEDKLLEKICGMISGILGACLTNLPAFITTKCFSNSIEKRSENVQLAARILGETEEILKFLQQIGLPCLNPYQVSSFDEWRAKIMQENPPTIDSSSNEGASASCPGEFLVDIGYGSEI